jgi:hypothetical protein
MFFMTFGCIFVHFERLWDAGGFGIEKIENFEKFPDGPESIGDVFGECLEAFLCNFRHLAGVWKHFGAIGGILATFWLASGVFLVIF